MSMWMILRIRFLSIGRMLLDLRPAEDPSSIQCVRLACSTVPEAPFPATPKGQNLYRPRIPTQPEARPAWPELADAPNIWRGCEFGAGTTRPSILPSPRTLARFGGGVGLKSSDDSCGILKHF